MNGQSGVRRGRPPGPPKERVDLWLMVEQAERLRLLARRQDRSVQAVVRRAVEALLEQEGA